MPPPRLRTIAPANRIFVDREEPKRTFETAAFAIPSDKAILRVFYGVGGQGKTALCREFMRMSDAAVDPAYGFLRRAVVDLHDKPKSDPDLLLVWIRNAFARSGLTFPCFDLALAIVWEGTRGEQPFPALVNPWLGRATDHAKAATDEGAGMAAEAAKGVLSETISQIPGVGPVLRRIGHWVIDQGKRAYLDRTREHLRRLYKADGELRPINELSAELPWMLAQDFNYHVDKAPKERFVLFVDEYERVFDQGGAGRQWVDNPFDRHMRGVVAETNGLLVVFFSRERLPWAEDPDWRADLADAQHLLGGLAEKDADTFLAAVPIDDAAIRAAIIDGAREKPDRSAPVYPLLLDLMVEHWQALAGRGDVRADEFRLSADTFAGRCRQIVERVLRDTTMASRRRSSACRSRAGSTRRPSRSWCGNSGRPCRSMCSIGWRGSPSWNRPTTDF